MLVGEHTDHVWTAFNDIRFQKIRRIYLLHSPNQTKDSHLIKCKKCGLVKPKIMYKDKAKKLKKDIEARSTKAKPVDCILKQLGPRGAFDKDETIDQSNRRRLIRAIESANKDNINETYTFSMPDDIVGIFWDLSLIHI